MAKVRFSENKTKKIFLFFVEREYFRYLLMAKVTKNQ